MMRVLLLALALSSSAHASPEAWRRSYAAEAAGDPAAALAELSEVKGPAYVVAIRRGWLLYRLGRHAEALSAYDKARRAAPEALEPRLGRLLPLAALRRWQDVEREARAILADAPRDRTARTQRAWALFNLGRFAEAEAVYRSVRSDWPADAEVAAGVGWSLLEQGKVTEAKAVFADVLAWAPAHAGATAGLAAAGG